MIATIRRFGNSRGVLIPARLLRQAGLAGQVEIRVEADALVLRRPRRAPRAGWAEASRQLAERGEDALVLPEFANEEDANLAW